MQYLPQSLSLDADDLFFWNRSFNVALAVQGHNRRKTATQSLRSTFAIKSIVEIDSGVAEQADCEMGLRREAVTRNATANSYVARALKSSPLLLTCVFRGCRAYRGLEQCISIFLIAIASRTNRPPSLHALAVYSGTLEHSVLFCSRSASP